MSSSTLMKIVQKIPSGKSLEELYTSIYKILSEIEYIYSAIVYYDKDRDKFIVQYNVSENDEFNTLNAGTVCTKVVDILFNADKSKKVCGYIQPSIEVCLETFNPYILYLAKKAKMIWKYLEEEDYAQICRMVMIRLHSKGYYLHKRLIEKSFNNELLMTFRNERNAPSVVSLEDVFYKPVSGASEELTFQDTLEDTSIKEQEERENIEKAEAAIYEEVKAIVIELIGERQWNELVRDYTNKHTTAWSRKKMTELKRYFEKLGLTRKEFNNKYYG